LLSNQNIPFTLLKPPSCPPLPYRYLLLYHPFSACICFVSQGYARAVRVAGESILFLGEKYQLDQLSSVYGGTIEGEATRPISQLERTLVSIGRVITIRSGSQVSDNVPRIFWFFSCIVMFAIISL
jgi:hypothetical protein